MFAIIDEARRRTGRVLDRFGLGPVEQPFRTIAEWPGGRLRAYGPPAGEPGPALLIVPAPFKRPYIWDLLPPVSVVRHAMSRSLRVYLLDWSLPRPQEDEFGLADYADRLPSLAIDAIEAEPGLSDVVMAGHSLGGTLAAIFASIHPERVGRLVLLDAPLRFGGHGGRLARWAAAIPFPHAVSAIAGNPVAGSFIDLLSVSAVPEAFLHQRYLDLSMSLSDPEALNIHARVERWTLDEFPLPPRLFQDVLVSLYREDRFASDQLQIGPRVTGISRIAAPLLAVVNPGGRVVPPESIVAALDGSPELDRLVLRYSGDRGTAIEHVGPLVSRAAHRELWPEIFSWMRQG